jgi:hypothetical protein
MNRKLEKTILSVWALSVIILFLGVFCCEKPTIGVKNAHVKKTRVKKEIKDTCNACAIHRIYGLKGATPHYK